MNDSQQEQPQLVEYGVYPSVLPKSCVTANFPCEVLPHKNNRIYMCCEVLEEIDDYMKIKDLDINVFNDWRPWDLGGFGYNNFYIRVT